jgi:hypothetical protein
MKTSRRLTRVPKWGRASVLSDGEGAEIRDLTARLRSLGGPASHRDGVPLGRRGPDRHSDLQDAVLVPRLQRSSFEPGGSDTHRRKEP